jgi:peroxiredoxin
MFNVKASNDHWKSTNYFFLSYSTQNCLVESNNFSSICQNSQTVLSLTLLYIQMTALTCQVRRRFQLFFVLKATFGLFSTFWKSAWNGYSRIQFCSSGSKYNQSSFVGTFAHLTVKKAVWCSTLKPRTTTEWVLTFFSIASTPNCLVEYNIFSSISQNS